MYNPGHGLRLRGSARTNTGRVRDNNEDSVHLWTGGNDHVVLAIVADGMGGAVAGEEASRIAVETIQDGLSKTTDQPGNYASMDQDVLIQHLKDAIRKANDMIVDEAAEKPEFKGMGTTVTLAFVRDSHVIIGHVGDSRAYLIDGHDSHIVQITADHSFVQALVAAGHISEEEAEDHPMKNVLYRALGQNHDIEVDIYYERLHVGDRLVLCSDGLTLHVKPEEIAELALEDDDPSLSSQKLVDLANQRGGRDNVSVIVIKAEQTDEAAVATAVAEAEIENADFLDEDTVVVPESAPETAGFASSESTQSPHHQQRDGSPDGQKSPGDSSQTPEAVFSTQTSGKDSDSSRIDTLGEGHDTLTPDQ